MIHRKVTSAGFGHTGVVTSTNMENRSYDGYIYRGLSVAGLAEILSEWETVKDWEYAPGKPAFAPKYAVKTPGITYLEDQGNSMIPDSDSGRPPVTAGLPPSTYLLTPDGGPGDLEILEWMKQQEQKGAGVIGLPAKGRRYNQPKEEMGRIIHSYVEVPVFQPPREDAIWLFAVTRDISLVSHLCEMNTHAAVLYEPKDGWLTPGQQAMRGAFYVGGAAAILGGLYWAFLKA